MAALAMADPKPNKYRFAISVSDDSSDLRSDSMLLSDRSDC